MRFVLFYHSLVSDWNHGNAHFLRGIVAELIDRGHQVTVYEPADGWSRDNLIRDAGVRAVEDFQRAFPGLRSRQYRLDRLDVDAVLNGADVVIVHEWSDHDLVRRVGEHHAGHHDYVLFFHDTHHRAVTDPESMSGYDLAHYDGVLAYGRVIRDIYLDRHWAQSAWTWHEAADVRVFHPAPRGRIDGDVVWIGNWGDDERTAELHEFFIDPVRDLRLHARVYGVRYPEPAVAELKDAGVEYGGWIANYRVPEVFSRYRMTVHVPRRPYAEVLPGIPTIRPFEAMACGIPMISAPWDDAEGLFTPGDDFLVARDGREMRRLMMTVLTQPAVARHLAQQGLSTILARHTCAHRVDELMDVIHDVAVREPTTDNRQPTTAFR